MLDDATLVRVGTERARGDERVVLLQGRGGRLSRDAAVSLECS